MQALVVDKQITSLLLDLTNILSAILGGLIGFIAKYLLELKKMKEDKKSVRQQMITNNIAPMRQAWINELRVSVSEYLSDIIFIVTYKNTKNSEFKKEFRIQYTNAVLSYQFKYSKLDLMLPFKREENDENEAEAVRKKLIEINKFVKNDENNIPSIECVKLKVQECRNSLKILLKKEWDETKSLKEIDGINNIRKKWYYLWMK